MSYDWVFTKISHLIENPPDWINFDPNCLFLINPITESEIDEIFYTEFLDKIEESFDDSNFTIFKGDDYPKIREKFSVRLTKKFTIVIEDPSRPFVPGQIEKAWFARFELELSKIDYMLTTDLILNLHENFDYQKMLQLLKNPYFEGLPPELSFDANIFTLSFHTGKGAGWGLHSYNEASNIVADKIVKIQQILNFINVNENELDNETNFLKLENLLVNYFQNW